MQKVSEVKWSLENRL